MSKAQSHVEQDQCQSEELTRLDKELNSIYPIALKSLPEHDEFDPRKQQEQLRKSQRAWLKYTQENCSLIGGLEGGESSWVSTFSSSCTIEEFKKRITYLRELACRSQLPCN
ncbi:lysozyme inhibitor LprI family protein [Pseudomonas leptonychotis]|uniref:lysozyme inhibitor LprI family protein n=1 Tax=Pseudomonas leptonychotis TaxID=2448482 RepID=UPI0039EE34FC